jgi:hypothetical protein
MLHTMARVRHMNRILKVAVLGALLLVATSANAATIVFNNAPGAGSQQGYLLGMDFVVNSAVWVSQLGTFDSGGDGIDGEINVAIFDTSGALVSPIATFNGGAGETLIGGSRFLSIAGFTLGPGTYSIVAAGYSGLDFSGNTGLGGSTSFNNAGGAISLVDEGGRWETQAGNALSLPTDNEGGYLQPDPVFQAGTFAVPDGGVTALLLGAGLAGLGWMRRRML